MNQRQKIEKLQDFRNEADFRIFLIDLIKRMGFSNVVHTHRYGSPEMGKDIIGSLQHPIDGDEWYAFVVKFGRIGGGTGEIEIIKGQIKQAFEYSYTDISGDMIRINKVKVVTNENFTQGAQTSLSTSSELRALPNIDYWYRDNLIPLIDKYYLDFWLPGDDFCKEYTKTVRLKIQEEFELKDLSLNIEDKKVKKLLTLFVEPKLTVEVIEEKKDHFGNTNKRLAQKHVSFKALINYEENIIITGEPGSGKTKLINNLTLSLLDPDKNAEEKIIPIKLKGKDLKDANFDIDRAILTSIELSAPETFARTNVSDYKKILLIDEIDFLSKDEKLTLTENINKYSIEGSRFILMQRKSDSIDLDSDDVATKSIRIHNFNIKQIELFIQKYFGGNDRGERFIQILKESNLFAKLPTTPLTITLLSLLYDQSGYEIPATITDIYDDFIKIMLGKLEVKDRTDLLLFNIKKRLFTSVALNMLDDKLFEISLDNFKDKINKFLKSKGYTEQTDMAIRELIENSGLLYMDVSLNVGFKQQAFIEYLASVEIYDHSRHTHYDKLLLNFNDIAWQNTAIFFAGKSKDLPEMINDLLKKMPNEDLRDWFINAGGLGYMAQALYLTNNVDRKELIKKALSNIVSAFYKFKEMSSMENQLISDLPLPLIALMLNTWFIESFKSITLTLPLNDLFNELAGEYHGAEVNDFNGDFKLFLIASTLLHKNINDDRAFTKLIERDSFIKNPVLMVAGDLFIDAGDISRKNINSEIKKKIEKQVRHHIKAIQNVIKEPAYRIDSNYRLLDKYDSNNKSAAIDE
jgi:hypothetical protein